MTTEQPTIDVRPRIFTRDFTLVFLANLTNFLGFYLLLSTLPTYVTNILHKEWLVGVVLGIFGIVGVVVRPVVGWLADRWGGKLQMLVGAVLLIGTMLIFPFAGNAPSLLALRVLHGVGWAMFGTAASAMVALIAPAARRGEAMGYYGVSTSVAMAVAPAVGLAIVKARGEYHTLFLVSAGLILLAGLAALAVRNRRPDVPAMECTVECLFLPSAIFPSILSGLSTFTYSAVVFYIVRYADHFKLEQGGLFFTVLAITLVVTRGPIGKLSDRFGRAQVLAPGLVCAGAAVMWLALPPAPWTLATVAVLFGIGTAAVQPTLMALASDGAGPAERGAAMGTYTTAFDLGIGLGAGVAGWIIGAAGFQAMYLLSGLMSLLCVVVLTAGGGFRRYRRPVA